MNALFSLLSPADLAAAAGVALLAGTVKGLVGFAMPMILVSGLSVFMPPELALAGLILPTLVTNGMQALRQGSRAAVDSVKRFRVFLLVGLLFLMGSAQMVRILPQQAMLLIIGAPVSVFVLMQLSGRRITITSPTRRAEALVGGFAGLIAVALLAAHIGSGVMRAETAPFSLALVLPAVAGMWIGGRLHDRIDQKAFRRATLLVLLVAGLNLLRRGLMG